MKPLKLEFCGINSFSENTVIDFEALTKNGIFGIFGDTGSGKSTILDCINFALYGDVERSKEKTDIINYRSQAAKVTFVFDVLHGGKRKIYTVERVLKKDKNGTHRAALYENDGEKEVCVADKATQVTDKIVEILGVDADDFRRCIALPQGEFAQFVKSTAGERLKLMERLFGLSKYGDSLKFKLGEHINNIESKYQNVKGRLSLYDGVNEEASAEIGIKLSDKISELEKLKAEQSALSVRHEEIKNKLVKKKEHEKTLSEINELLNKKEEIDELRNGLSTLSACREAVSLSAEITEKTVGAENIKRDKKRLFEQISNQKSQIVSLTKQIESENFDEKLNELISLSAKYSTCDGKSDKLKRTLKELDNKRELYRRGLKSLDALKSERDGLAEQIKKLSDSLNSLSSGNFESLSGVKIKGAILKEEYVKTLDWLANFKGNVKNYSDNSPLYEYVICETDNKISEYTRRISDVRDFCADGAEKLIADFENREKAREESRKTLDGLNARILKLETDIAVRQNEINGFEKEGRDLKARAEELSGELESVFGKGVTDYDRLIIENQRDIKALRSRRDELTANCESAKTRLSGLEISAERLNTLEITSETELKNLKEKLDSLLKEKNLSGLESCKERTKKFENYPDAEKAVKDFDSAMLSLTARRAELEKQDVFNVSDGDLTEVESSLRELAKSISDYTGGIAVLEKSRDDLEKRLDEKKSIEKEFASVEKEKILAEKLKEITRGNKFLEYVADEYLNEISSLASSTLLNLTDGRYFLKYSDSNFAVGDNFNCGNLRGVNTLSGGETFLVSLSLALALSRTICSKSLKSIEFFFLDEGFGTLDGNLVDTVMTALEKLKSSAFTIGVISHVEELKYRIPSKITVYKATESHGSTVSSSC